MTSIPKRRVDPVPAVLVVDDSLEDRDALQRGAQAAIDALGDQVETGRVATAGDVESAIHLLAQNHFDVVVTDLQLTPENANEGWDVLRYAKKPNGTRVIIVTAFSTPEVEARSITLGAFSIIDKLQHDLVDETMHKVLQCISNTGISGSQDVGNEKTGHGQSGEANIAGTGDFDGDIVGRDKILPTDGAAVEATSMKWCFDKEASLLRLQAILSNCQRRLYTRFDDLSSETMRLTTSLGSHDLHPDKLGILLSFLANEYGLNVAVAGGASDCTTIILNISAPADGYLDIDKILDDPRFHAFLESSGIEYASYASIDRLEAVYGHRIGGFLYGTDRTRSVTCGGTVRYGTEYSPSIEFGIFEATMPGFAKAREQQNTDFFSVVWRRTKSVFATLFSGRVKLTHLNPFINVDDFSAYLRKHFVGNWDVLMYVHGFNNSFEESAVALAQFSDMCALHRYNFIPILFAWPSGGESQSYLRDVAMASRCRPHFLQALTLCISSHKTNVLAHSHGASLVIESIGSASNRLLDIRQPALGELILIAPDIDAVVLENSKQYMEVNCSRTTVYISSNDVALSISQALWGFPRAGSVMRPVARRNVELVDVSKARQDDRIGHSPHLNCPEVRYDIMGVLKGVSAVNRGPWIQAKDSEDACFEIVRR